MSVPHAPRRMFSPRCKALPYAGFSLIELMIAMLLGLIVAAGSASLFLAARRSDQTNQALVDVQESARMAVTMLRRDIRQAGANGCNGNGRMADVLSRGPLAGGDAWWADWRNAVHGYAVGQADPAVATGTATGQRVAGTPSIQLLGADGQALSLARHDAVADRFILNEHQVGLQAGDIVVVCDPDHAAMLQIDGYTSVVSGVDYAGAGNCSVALGFPAACGSGLEYRFPRNASLSGLFASDWYIGNNDDHGRSLYRIGLTHQAGAASAQREEMVRGVNAMRLAYHVRGQAGFVDASHVGNWQRVDTLRIGLTLTARDTRAGAGFRPLQRRVAVSVSVRSRRR